MTETFTNWNRPTPHEKLFWLIVAGLAFTGVAVLLGTGAADLTDWPNPSGPQIPWHTGAEKIRIWNDGVNMDIGDRQIAKGIITSMNPEGYCIVQTESGDKILKYHEEKDTGRPLLIEGLCHHETGEKLEVQFYTKGNNAKEIRLPSLP